MVSATTGKVCPARRPGTAIGDFGVEPVCRELDLSVSAYNARRRRPMSSQRQRDEQLMEHIQRIHEASGQTYGARRIERQLRREGIITARCTIERFMVDGEPVAVHAQCQIRRAATQTVREGEFVARASP